MYNQYFRPIRYLLLLHMKPDAFLILQNFLYRPFHFKNPQLSMKGEHAFKN